MRILFPGRKLAALRAGIRRSMSGDGGSQIAEFAISVPLLVVFVVGIFDFGGAFNVKQRIGSAAQEGAVLAASQPTRDLDQANPGSVQAVLGSVFNYLANQRVLANANSGTCTPGSAVATHTPASLAWTYTINGCPDALVITIDRGKVFNAQGGSAKVVSSQVSVSYPYRWQFGRVIGLVVTGATYAATTSLAAAAVSQNQL